MTAADLFIDTNILIYAHDLDGGAKNQRARTLVERLWRERSVPTLSIQVLQEMLVNLVRKGVPTETSARIVSSYLAWRVVENSKLVFERALLVQARWQVSFWDASIIAAAQLAGAKVLWSEDLSDGQDFDGVTVHNPLPEGSEPTFSG